MSAETEKITILVQMGHTQWELGDVEVDIGDDQDRERAMYGRVVEAMRAIADEMEREFAGVVNTPTPAARPVCACGCGYPLVDSLYWYSEICHIRWLGQQSRQAPSAVRVFCGSTYTETPAEQACERGAAFPQVALKDPQVTRGERRGPVLRLLGRLFGHKEDK